MRGGTRAVHRTDPGFRLPSGMSPEPGTLTEAVVAVVVRHAPPLRRAASSRYAWPGRAPRRPGRPRRRGAVPGGGEIDGSMHAALIRARDCGGACTAGRVVVRVEPSGAPAFDMEVAQGDGPSFRHAGPSRLSPLLEVDDFPACPCRCVTPSSRLAAWIPGAPDRASPSARRRCPMRLTPRHPRWRSTGGLGCRSWRSACSCWRARGAPPNARRRPHLSAACSAALVLRLALGAWGPLRINGLGPLWMLSAASTPSETAFYGPGYPELFGWLAHVAALRRPGHLRGERGAVGAVGGPRLRHRPPRGTLASGRGARRRDALRGPRGDPRRDHRDLPGADHRADPRRVGPGDRRGHHLARHERGRAFALTLACALLTVQAARIHPSAWGPCALAPLCAVACRQRTTTLRRLAVALAVGGVTAAAAILTSARVLLDVANHVLSGDLFRPALYVPSLAATAWLLGLVAVAAISRRARWLALVAALNVAALLVTRLNYSQSELWMNANERLFVAMPVLTVAALVPPAWLAARAVRTSLLAAPLVALAVWGPRVLSGRTTEHREYTWARDWLSTLPAGCRTLNVAFAGHHNLFLPTYAASARPQASFVRVDARHPVDLSQTLGAVRCTYYVRTSLCSTDEGRAACEEVERELELEPVARASFPAVADNLYSGFDTNPIETVVSRVVALRPRGSALSNGP